MLSTGTAAENPLDTGAVFGDATTSPYLLKSQEDLSSSPRSRREDEVCIEEGACMNIEILFLRAPARRRTSRSSRTDMNQKTSNSSEQEQLLELRQLLRHQSAMLYLDRFVAPSSNLLGKTYSGSMASYIFLTFINSNRSCS